VSIFFDTLLLLHAYCDKAANGGTEASPGYRLNYIHIIARVRR